jgi:RHS repeat-associated protein
VSDSAGALIGINRYDEYGIPASTNIGRFQYTGQAFLAEAGLHHYKARAYSPTLGRFMQTDPIGYKDGINWYDYVGGDPVNRSDPTGLLSGAELFTTAVEFATPVVETGATAGAVAATIAAAGVAIVMNAVVGVQPVNENENTTIGVMRSNTPTTAGGRGATRGPGERRQAGSPRDTPKPEKTLNPNDGTRKDNQSGKTIRPAPARPTPPPEPERVPRTRKAKKKAENSDE